MLFPELRVEPMTMRFECDVPAFPRYRPGSEGCMMPGETRHFRGRIMSPFRALRGLCATDALRDAVRFTFDSKHTFDPSAKCIEVRVTLSSKAKPSRVEPALYILGSDTYGFVPDSEKPQRGLLAPRPYHQEWRTILPLEPVHLDEPASFYHGPEVYAVAPPQTTFRGRQLVIEPSSYWPHVKISELRVGNTDLWFGPVPAGIFLEEEGYELPEIDMPSANPAQRVMLGFTSSGPAGRIVVKIKGDGFVP